MVLSVVEELGESALTWKVRRVFSEGRDGQNG